MGCYRCLEINFFLLCMISLIASQMDLKPKKLYSPRYNLLFNIIAIPSEAFFVSIKEFVDAHSIPCWVLLFEKINRSFFQTFFICKTTVLLKLGPYEASYVLVMCNV